MTLGEEPSLGEEDKCTRYQGNFKLLTEHYQRDLVTEPLAAKLVGQNTQGWTNMP